MGVSKVDYNGENLIDLSNDSVTPATLAEGATAHNSNGDLITGTMTAGGGGSTPVGSDSVFIVNAVGTLLIDVENFIVAPNEIISTDKTVEKIIQATQQGKLVYMCLDTSDSWNQQLEDDTTLTLWIPLVSSNSNMDVVFGGLYDLSGVGLPLVVRIMGARDEFVEDNVVWHISVTPVAPLS